MHYSTGVLRSP